MDNSRTTTDTMNESSVFQDGNELVECKRSHDIEGVQHFLSQKTITDVNAEFPATRDGGTLLEFALEFACDVAAENTDKTAASYQIVESLLEKGAKFGPLLYPKDYILRKNLLSAVAERQWDILQLLMNTECNMVVSEDDGTLLHRAANTYFLSDSVLSRLLKSQVFPVDVEDSKGETPLYLACKTGNVQKATALLKHGADIHKENKEGWSPLVVGLASQLKMIRFLVARYGKKVIVHKTSKGITPLHASSHDCYRISTLKYLVRNGADLLGDDGARCIAKVKENRDKTAETYLREERARQQKARLQRISALLTSLNEIDWFSRQKTVRKRARDKNASSSP